MQAWERRLAVDQPIHIRASAYADRHVHLCICRRGSGGWPLTAARSRAVIAEEGRTEVHSLDVRGR